jgi:4a-hydroxytetrahydrobiopterin dehydratase
MQENMQDFMTAVSLQCKIWNHHPEWSNVSQKPNFSEKGKAVSSKSHSKL